MEEGGGGGGKNLKELCNEKSVSNKSIHVKLYLKINVFSTPDRLSVSHFGNYRE